MKDLMKSVWVSGWIKCGCLDVSGYGLSGHIGVWVGPALVRIVRTVALMKYLPLSPVGARRGSVPTEPTLTDAQVTRLGFVWLQ